ncbi:hypothetical protein K0039_20805, partial [Terrisporobacter mayombei]|nr:hypothetical protein [Terrisporobacter mayombei]
MLTFTTVPWPFAESLVCSSILASNEVICANSRFVSPSSETVLSANCIVGLAPGTVLAQNSYKVNKQWLRYAGHTASDEVFEKLTGIKGAFRTRIAYVVQTNGGQFPYE